MSQAEQCALQLGRTADFRALYSRQEPRRETVLCSYKRHNRGGALSARTSNQRINPQGDPFIRKAKRSKMREHSSKRKEQPLPFLQTMFCGALSRSVAQTMIHPFTTCKTLLQQKNAPSILKILSQPRRLTYGAGASLVVSLPTGAVNYAVLEAVRYSLEQSLFGGRPNKQHNFRLALDALASALATTVGSVVSTPGMVIQDNIMAGRYPNLVSAFRQIARQQGIAGFYRGWAPSLVSKLPSYALTWTLFQQFQRLHERAVKRKPSHFETTIMASLASATTVCLLIPVDTVKTRLVTQSVVAAQPYKGIVDCTRRVLSEEGIAALYRGLSPRLISVVPLIGVQFAVYEGTKQFLLDRQAAK